MGQDQTAATCPPGAALTGCVVGTPTGPLTLLATSPNAFIQTDSSNPTSPILSGTPLFNGAIAMLFSSNQAAVRLDGGFLMPQVVPQSPHFAAMAR